MAKGFNVTTRSLRLITLFITFSFSSAGAQQLILYVDMITKQVYTEPGENRVKLGTFQQVEEPLPARLQERTDVKPDQSPVNTIQADPEQDKAAPRKNIRPFEVQSNILEKPAKAVTNGNESSATQPKGDKRWYDRIGIKGFAQFRYSKSLWGDKEDISYWQDDSVNPNNSFLIKRVRLALFGDITDHLYLHLQSDFVSTPSGSSSTHFVQLRDVFADISFDKKKEFRIRIGQSKVPYGFENVQSSQIRLALDRDDAMSSCCQDGRDIGAFFYWIPTHIRERFKNIMARNLKGTGDYGMFAFGVYNGQGANRFELNNDVHMVIRFTYPHQFENGQIIEAGIQAIQGRYVASNGPNATGFTPALDAPGKGFKDQRIGLHAILYPQPFGLQAEWNWGKGPQLNTAQTALTETSLNGGYVQAMYKIDKFRWGPLLPFIKWQYYDGALKFERNAPKDRVRDLELGIEWQILPEIKMTAIYHMMNRTNVMNAPYERYKADILRFQLQWNYF